LHRETPYSEIQCRGVRRPAGAAGRRPTAGCSRSRTASA